MKTGLLLVGCLFGLGLALAHAKSPPTDTSKHDAIPHDKIDVDAMARAKDTDAPAQPSTEAPANPADTSATTTDTTPTQTASPQSASPDEATPPVPDASERRLIQSCESRATTLLDAAEKGDYAAATHDFNAKTRAGMPPEKFKQAWASLAQFGKLEARGQSHPGMAEGYSIVNVPLIFEKANLNAQVVCGSDGLIAGFNVTPLETPNP